MAFLVPTLLGALAALAIPVLVHLRFREKDTPFRFPSLMFLVRIPIRTAQRRRLSDWPLFLLRALALAALVLAFARPYRPARPDAAGTDAARAVVLLVDRSLSMGHADVPAAALDSARAVVDGLRPGDRVAIVWFDETSEVAQPWTEDLAAARAALAELPVAARGTRYAAALRTARQLLADAEGGRPELVLVSDLQRSGTAGLAGLELPAGLPLRSIALAPASRANAAVQGVELRRDAGPPRATITAQARVMARELGEARRVRVVLTLNGREAAAREVTLVPDGQTIVAFDPVAAPAGRITGTVTLTPDALPGDDTLHFALPRDEALRALLLTPSEGVGSETLFTERALAIGTAPSLRVTSTPAASLTSAMVRESDLVLAWDVAAPTALAEPLAEWVRAGGGYVTVVGTRLAARLTPGTLLPAQGGALAERPAQDPARLGELSLEHPLFSPFREAGGALSAVRFARHARVEPTAGAAVLARFDDGAPAVLEAALGRGRTLVLATPLDARGGDFPLQPAFLPFLRRLALYASGHIGAPAWRLTGESWLLRATLPDPVVVAPDGALERPPADPAGAAVVLRQAGLYSAYSARPGGEPLEVVAVNAPPGESDLTPVDARELLLGIRETEGEAAGLAGTPSPEAVESRQGLWRWLLAAVALALLAETLLATRGWRAQARRTGVLPPDRSPA
jgi:hypothetical protein